MIYVKICGITDPRDAHCAAEAGADFLGFVFYPRSPRFVTAQRAAAITAAIRREFGAARPRFVGVFVNEPAAWVGAILDEAGLDLAQLHGDEPPAVVQALAPRAFKAIRPESGDAARAAVAAYAAAFVEDEAAPHLLLDAYHPQHFGGTGIRADLAAARRAAGRCRLLLAGGLTPESVGPAIEAVRPWGVDVSSGVELAPGVKDHARLRAFVQAAQGAS